MVNATKEELTQAFKTWNIEFLENSANFDSETESSDEYAERQASELIELIEHINRVQEL